jgi:FkbM family methyltransferase
LAFCWIAKKTKIAHPYFEELLSGARRRSIMKFYDREERCFNFNGAKLPDISNDKEKLNTLKFVFDDVLLILCRYGENYSKEFVELLDKYMMEGPYGYVDGNFDVSVKAGDVVIDAGAWIGDFSAYAASKNAICYAFEPTKETFDWLCRTAVLNDNKIIPVQFGLGNKIEDVKICRDEINSSANYIIQPHSDNDNGYETVKITNLDSFAETQNLQRIDFIKADIEGFERLLLLGAKEILKKFAPKLAICTYHLPDDPQVLESIIKEVNPDYKVVHLRHKLFASTKY